MSETLPPKCTAYRVETERLVLRCWSPLDAPVLRAALDANDQHPLQKAWQKEQHLQADGIAGRDTYRAMGLIS